MIVGAIWIATGTGKTVVAASISSLLRQKKTGRLCLSPIVRNPATGPNNLRNVLRDQNLVNCWSASRPTAGTCLPVGMLSSRRLGQVGKSFYDYIVVDEAHHGTASYRPIFGTLPPDSPRPDRHPERMDGDNVAADRQPFCR
jgi:hypothetical protein